MTGYTGTFGVSDAPGTEAQVPHIVQYLWDAYVAHLAEVLADMTARGESAATLEQAKKAATAAHFAKWATQHLSEVRPAEVFYHGGDVGVRLSNHAGITISPVTDVRGTMQESHTVAVTEERPRRTNPGAAAPLRL